MNEDSKTCEDCGYPEDSFACKIRHQHLQNGWAASSHR